MIIAKKDDGDDWLGFTRRDPRYLLRERILKVVLSRKRLPVLQAHLNHEKKGE